MNIRELGSNIWAVDGPEVVFAGASMHTRMTVVKLNDGHLWVHSPTKLDAATQAFVSELGGSVGALVAPNKYHHLFVAEWAEAYPGARIFAEPEVKRKVPFLASAEDIGDVAPEFYRAEVSQVLFEGNRLFQEAVFFHHDSETLILTDLMVNLKTEGVPLLARWFLKFEQVTFPNGGVPRLYRWFTRDKTKARQALQTVLGWQPKQLTFCHGEPFSDNIEDLLTREFEWLM